MSRTSSVPAAVPSLLQSSQPVLPTSALKNAVPPTLMIPLGNELLGPGRISLTILVPAVVPSLLHDAFPLPLLPAVKNARPPTRVSSDVAFTSFTSSVPPAVPSLLHRPQLTKSRVPRTLVKPPEEHARSETRSVPAAVPS